MSINIKPLADRLVVVREEAESKTTSGLFIPDAAKEKSVIAKVVAVGKDVKEVKVADRIVYREYAPTELKQGADEYMLLKEADVLAVVA